jgi:hypothetical protein
VSEELGERKQDVGTKDSLIGYAIRLESKVTKDTKLIYATTVRNRFKDTSVDSYEIRVW